MTNDIIEQLKAIVAGRLETLVSSQGDSEEERALVRLINAIIAELHKAKKQSVSLKSNLLSDIDCLAEVLGKISLGNFDIEIPSMRIPDMDTVRIGIVDMKTKLKEGNIARNEREKVLRDLKTLSGLIPICSSCKKIRDDEGDWTQIEAYIQEHSEAEFSHGICQECAAKLYPDYFDKDETR
jgi:hypothetical protein